MQKIKEPIPRSEYVLARGDVFLSAGKSIIYKVIDGPVCKLYRDVDKPGTYEPWGTESSWYDTGCPIKGWRKNGPNFPSYYVELIDPETMKVTSSSITLRWIPLKVTLLEAINIVNKTRIEYLNSPSGVFKINIPDKAIKNMKSNVDFCCD